MQALKFEGNTLAADVARTMNTHLDTMGKDGISNLYKLLMEQVEPPLLKAVIERCRYNQSKAAQMLGLSRGTLRKKLTQYFDSQYCGTRD